MKAGLVPQGFNPSGVVHSQLTGGASGTGTEAEDREMAKTRPAQMRMVLVGESRILINVSRRHSVVKCEIPDTPVVLNFIA